MGVSFCVWSSVHRERRRDVLEPVPALWAPGPAPTACVGSVGPLSTRDKQIIVKKQSLNTADTQTGERTRLTARRPAPESHCLLDGTQRRTGGGEV